MNDTQSGLRTNLACVFTLGAGSYSDYGIVGAFADLDDAKTNGETFARTHNYDDDLEVECYIIGEIEPVERNEWNDNEPERSWDWRHSRVVAKWKWDGEPDRDWSYEGVDGHWEDVNHEQ